jgi:ribonuclease BN (tRNA processing enzyme)
MAGPNDLSGSGAEEMELSKLSITVLGASPAWVNPGGACSGYLVSNDVDNILLECGPGILSRLREQLPLDQLAAVVISHLHADHFGDLIGFRYGLKYGNLRNDPALPLFAPPGATEFFARLGRALDGDAHFFDHTFCLTEFQPGSSMAIGSLELEFSPVKHYVPAYAIAVTAGKRLVFSGDAAPCQSLIDVARGADLFVCEAALSRREEDDPDDNHRGHMLATEAAEIAREAGVKRLLLTHYRTGPQNVQAFESAR